MDSQTVSPKEFILAGQYIKERDFWLSKLSGEPGKSFFYYDLKPEKTSSKENRSDFNEEKFSFPAELSSQAIELSNGSDPRLHMILAAGLVVLILHYTGNRDIIIGSPIYKQDIEVKFLNTVLVLRNVIHDMMTFKELLLEVKQTITEAAENVNYPMEILPEQLGIEAPEHEDYPLFDISILLENIHDKKYIRHINHNTRFSFIRKDNVLAGSVEYNSTLYHRETIRRIINHFINVFQQVLFNINKGLFQIDVLSGVEKQRLLYEFNDTRIDYPVNKTIHRLFEEQAEQTPDKIAVYSPMVPGDMFTGISCFKRNSFIYDPDIYDSEPEVSGCHDNTAGHKTNFILLKTHRHNCVLVNRNMMRLIYSFDGETDLESMFLGLRNLEGVTFIIYSIETKDLLEITHDLNCPPKVFGNLNFADFIALIKLLYENNLIEPAPITSRKEKAAENRSPASYDVDESFDDEAPLKDLFDHDKTLSTADVLLLGDTPGIPTTGLLYLASFLRRNGVKVSCRFYDDSTDYPAMKTGLEELLKRIKPGVVAISMKWFLYIARVLDMCRIVKAYAEKTARPIGVVVGGNTASYYWQDIIKYDFIDYVIRGDGELPLLEICQEKNPDDIPNCAYKKNGKIVGNPITYIQDETNSRGIYLSHLEELLGSNHPSHLGTFFIFTHKGCAMNCFYCGGCNQAQQRSFNRENVSRRRLEQVRTDIMAARRFTSTFQFDFDFPDKNLLDYCQQLWKGIDLSGHFCVLSTLTYPGTDLIRLVGKTFKYVYWDFDICSLSERHRKQLFSLGLIKPPPSDQDILNFMDRCEQYDNIEIRLNLITGLPYFTSEDIEPGERLLSRVTDTYSCFGELHWARLHAQPGASIVKDAEKYHMHSYASTYEDFLDRSQMNFDRNTPYANIENVNYAYVYFKDDQLNSRITNFYLDNNKKIEQYKKNKQKDVLNSRTLTYRELNEKANRLARLLKSKGVIPDSIVGILLNPSLEIPVSILAVLKAGAGYLPLEPRLPSRRISALLQDSGVSVLLTREDVISDELFRHLQTPCPDRGVPGVTVTSSRRQIANLDHLPVPDRSLVDYEKYSRCIGQALVKNCMAVQATRGCPYKCAYCHKIWPKTHVARSAEHILAEIQRCYQLGVRRFAFIDDIFNLNIKNSRRFFELIIKNNLDLQLFFPNGMRGDLLTHDYIDLLVEAGTVNIALALETASPRLQKLLGKNIKLGTLRENLEYFCETYPHVILELFTMHGFPTETEEEAIMTLDFIKSLQWTHFPYVAILHIFPNTDMEKLAVENGISPRAIACSGDMAFHQLPETLPFDKSFTLKYQADFLNGYFLAKERLLKVMPHQLQVMTRDEMVQKYNSYLPVDIKTFADLLQFIEIREEELGIREYLREDVMAVPDLNEKLRELFPGPGVSRDSLKVLLLDLSQFFSTETNMLYDVVKPPLGLMYLLTYLQQQYREKIFGKIAKSRIDFDNYLELKKLLENFQPDIIGIRTLTFYQKFFHKTTALIRQWGIEAPIIAGGPYATSGYVTLLQDLNVDVVVLGEGEVTFSELIGKIMANGGRLPDQEELKDIPGIAFNPAKKTKFHKPGITDHTPILLDQPEEVLNGVSVPDIKFPGQPGHTVYTIYTSGSSGKPKGVVVNHENLVNYVNWFTKTTNLTGKDKTMLTSSFAFDLGYTSLYTTLLTGGELHLLSRDFYLQAEGLLDYIKQKKITYIKMTPSLFTLIVNHHLFSREKCQSLRLAVLGGEVINLEDIEKARSLCPHLQIMNHYGPTEATIGCIAAFIDFNQFEEYKKHPVIGTPIYNTYIYILNKESGLLPPGVPGELCISGACLARGYLNQPELTAEKFSSNKKFLPGGPGGAVFSKSAPPGRRRQYRTGDQARWLPEGNIEFLGRIDHQVKIRGYRIELGEIENRLRKHPRVEEALVVVKEKNNTQKDRYLCAYIVSGSGKPQFIEKEKTTEKIAKIPGMSSSVPFGEMDIAGFQEQVNKNPGEIAIKSNRGSLTYGSLDSYAGQAARLIRENYDDRYILSKRERTRYRRQMLLYNWGAASQEKLKSTTVFVAGAGGGASPTIMQLALTGVGTIIVCDCDEVELSNLNRQFLHDETRIGMNKALSARMTIERINPHVTVIPITERLTADNVFDLVGDSAVIFDMFDEQQDKFILSQCAVVKGIPHIISAMTDISGYAVVFHTPYTPCFHCLYDKKKLEEIIAGMSHLSGKYEKNPLPVAASSLFMSTGFAVNEAIKIILGFENPAYGKFLFFNQRGTEKLAYTAGYRAMTYTFGDHFRRTSKEQGFDWDIGWRGNFLEELTITPDPHCPLCSENHRERRKTPEEQMRKVNTSIHIEETRAIDGNPPTGKNKTVALLLNHDIFMAVGIIGVLKAGMIYVPLAPASSGELLRDILADSESRILLTDNDGLNLAEKLRDEVNKNIEVVNINSIRIDELNDSHEDPGKIELGTLSDLSMELSGYLSEQIPDYMIPSYFVPVDKIPLTPNGKIDIKALPEPGKAAATMHRPPRDRVEEKLARLWSGVLGVEQDTININSNFFSLGGHSLNAAIMIAKVHKELDVKVPMTEVFKAPTIEGLAEYIKHTVKDTFVSIPAAEKKEYYVLSSGQKRLYLLQQMEPESPAYNILQVVRLEGRPDKQRLEESFCRVIRRHESLRTLFDMVDDLPVQKTHREVEFKIDYYDLREKGSGDRYRQEGEGTMGLVPLFIKKFIRAFDLSRAPLLRAGLIKIDHREYIFMVDMHHIITDGLSHSLLIKDFVSLYQGKTLPALRLQYKDYSEWQQQGLATRELKLQKAYWLKEFKSLPPVLNLPVDYPRPLLQSFEGSVITFETPPGELKALKELARTQESTQFMLLLAIFNIFLSKITSQEDIVVATPIAGRKHADLEPIIGIFINTLALRNFPAPEMSFLVFLSQLKERIHQAFENQDYPFEDLVENTNVEKDMSRNPLCDAMFDYHTQGENSNLPAQDILEGLKIIPHTSEINTSKFDLSMTAGEAGNQLVFSVEYCTRLFKQETLWQFTRYFKKILLLVGRDPAIKIKEIEIITGEEKKQILVDFNETKTPLPTHRSLHQLFAEQVERRPDHTALIGRNPEYENRNSQPGGTRERAPLSALSDLTSITYRELNDRANQLAGTLKQKGVKPGTIIGIMVERSLVMMAGLMAVLKAGAAYLPLDPDYPHERINYILKDSNAAILMSTGDYFNDQLSIIHCQSALQKEKQTPVFSHRHPPFSTGSSQLAYIIYTSGSTGKPKGTMIDQISVVNILSHLEKLYPLGEAGAYLLKTNCTFDVSVTELFGWFFGKGKLVILEPQQEKDPGKIIESIEQHRVTHINFVPSMLQVFLDYVNQGSIDGLKGLQYIFVAGEVFSPALAVQLKDFVTRVPARVENIYGPTEATIYTTKYSLREFNNLPHVPIGQPLDNINVFIIDRGNRLLPVKIPGELCISGIGLARGYLNNPQLTARKFIKIEVKEKVEESVTHMSYKSDTSYLFYKTGDLARWLPDGNIQFLGRIDNQIKIRGFRVEPGEIENQLLTHKLIREAVVTTWENSSRGKYLCAYFAIRSREQGAGELNLKEYLSARLPGYMIPPVFILLESFPLTAAGKIDRNALPEPGIIPDQDFVAPRNKPEQELAAIWAETLGMEEKKIGIDTNFFRIGGHSLNAITLISRVHKKLEVKLSLVEMFKRPFIRHMAKYIASVGKERFFSIETTEKKEFYKLSPAQKRLFFLYRFEPGSVSYNMPTVVELKGDVDRNRIEKTSRKLIRRHESLRTSFELLGEEPVQKIHEKVEFKLEYDGSVIPHPSPGLIRPFDLSQAPLIRVKIIKKAGKKSFLLIDMHHIITDGLSQIVLTDEFTTLYNNGELPRLRLQYRDYAEWQTSEIREKTMAKQGEYWLNRFSGHLPILQLPLDYDRPTLPCFEGRETGFEIESREAIALNQLALERGMTLYIVLLAIYFIFLSKICNQTDIIVGTPGANRSHVELQRVIGMFVNVLAIRSYPDPGKTCEEFLAEIKDTMLKAYENQDYPYDELVGKLNIPRQMDRDPLVETHFVFQKVEAQQAPEESESRDYDPAGESEMYQLNMTKLDLTLFALETGDKILCTLEYKTRLFKQETISKFGRYLVNIVKTVVKNPDQTLGEIDLLSEKEKDIIVTNIQKSNRMFSQFKGVDFNETF